LLTPLARGAALFRRQPGPFSHAVLQALLGLRLHLRVTLGDGNPFLPAFRIELVPLAGKRGEDLLLLGCQFRPCGSPVAAAAVSVEEQINELRSLGNNNPEFEPLIEALLAKYQTRP